MDFDKTKAMGIVQAKLHTAVITLIDSMLQLEKNVNEVEGEIPEYFTEARQKVNQMYCSVMDHAEYDVSKKKELSNEFNDLLARVCQVYLKEQHNMAVLSSAFSKLLNLEYVKSFEEGDYAQPPDTNVLLDMIKETMQKLSDYDADELMKNMMPCVPLKMTKERYKDYVSMSFSLEADEDENFYNEFNLEMMKKMFFALPNEEMKKYKPELSKRIIDIHSKDYSEHDAETVSLMCEEFMDLVEKEVPFISIVEDLFSITTYMKVISSLAFDEDMLFFSDEVRDAYLAVRNCIETNDYSFFDEIENRLEIAIERSLKEEKRVSKGFTFPDVLDDDDNDVDTDLYSNAYFLLEHYLDAPVDLHCSLMSKPLSREKFIKDFFDYTTSFDLPPKKLREIRNEFFSKITCPFIPMDFYEYLKYSLESCSDLEYIISSARIFTVLSEKNSSEN